MRIRSVHSRRTEEIHRSAIAFMRGIRTPVSTVVIPALLRISSISVGYLASRSRMSDDELIKVEPWPVERGADLVRTVAGDVLGNVWTAETRDLLTAH